MLKKVVMAAMIAASSIVTLPAVAQTPPIPACAVNCVFIATLDGGYWICEVQQDCVE